jgi:hypothetical protein
MVLSLRYEDRLEGANNFRSWRTRLLVVLEENNIQDHVNKEIPEPEGDDEKVAFRMNEGKAKRIIIDSVKDHLIPHISGQESAKKMFDGLVGLFETNNTSRRLALRHQLQISSMSRTDTVATYFMKISQLRDQLKTIGDEVTDDELVTIALNGFSSSWDPFVQGICSKDVLPKFEHLWNHSVQEEARLLSKQSLQRPPEDGTQALASNAKKGRRPFNNKRPFGKKGPKHAHGHEHKKKDISEIQCFNCDEFGHYASQCPHEKRKRKQHASVADMDNVPQKKAKEPDLKDLADGIREGFF